MQTAQIVAISRNLETVNLNPMAKKTDLTDKQNLQNSWDTSHINIDKYQTLKETEDNVHISPSHFLHNYTTQSI